MVEAAAQDSRSRAQVGFKAETLTDTNRADLPHEFMSDMGSSQLQPDDLAAPEEAIVKLSSS